MSANTETIGADRKKCKAWCGTYAKHSPAYNRFWDSSLRCSGDHAPVHWCSRDCREQKRPPIAAPAAHIERRKGQRWRMRNVMLGADFSGVLAEDTGATWKLSDVVAMDGKGTDRRFRADMWATPDTTMTLLADAPPEPAKCEPWCGNDLPPEGRPGWGFLLDDDADIAERFKLGRAGFVKRDLAIGWCTDECRESYISKTGFREMKSPPAQEAPKAARVCVGQGKLHQGAALERYVKNIGTGYVEHRLLCDACHLWHEKQFIELTAPRSTGAPYAGPERLPRPQLAADWVEDCLGDVR